MLWVVFLPYVFIGLGAASNQLVLIANHDKFPVMENGWRASQYEVRVDVIDPEGHCLMTKDTHLNFLADIFDFKDAIYSIGDLSIMLGEWLNTFCIFVWIALVVKSINLKATV